MGWWKTETGECIGDGALDLVDEFLGGLAEEYEEAYNRKPSINELLVLIQCGLQPFASEFLSGCDEFEIKSIKASTKKAPKRYRPKPGDIFRIPLEKNTYGFGRMTPQFLVAQIFFLQSSRPVPIKEMVKLKSFTFCGLDTDPIEKRRWPVIGNIAFKKNEHKLIHYGLGSQITCGRKVNKDGFILVDSKFKTVGNDKASRYPPISISPENLVLEKIKKRLKSKK